METRNASQAPPGIRSRKRGLVAFPHHDQAYPYPGGCATTWPTVPHWGVRSTPQAATWRRPTHRSSWSIGPGQQGAPSPSSIPALYPIALPTSSATALPHRWPTGWPTSCTSAWSSSTPSSSPTSRATTTPTSWPTRSPTRSPTVWSTAWPSAWSSAWPPGCVTTRPRCRGRNRRSGSQPTFSTGGYERDLFVRSACRRRRLAR